ncbi:peptidase M20 [Sphingopyxis macrogoltabida]|nr:peptidase M20 [Sphingopyxis macrogoltabida]
MPLPTVGKRLPILAATLASAMATTPACLAKPLDVAAEKAAISRRLDTEYPQLDALYKDLHRHPELSHQEVRTAAKLAAEMRRLGFEVTEGVGGTGIVAILRNGTGPTVLVRTDLDALPMEEKTGLPYASKARQTWQGKLGPVAHSCGHDVHMATWIGTAAMLAASRERWNGTLMFAGQPGEEAGDGAQKMLDDGLFKRFGKPDFGFALHVAPAPAGAVMYKSGAVLSNYDDIEIRFNGRGGHGAMPAATIDPILQAARFIVEVQSVVSLQKDPLSPGIISIGAIQGGSAGNIIPDTAIINGTMRSFTPETRAVLRVGIERTAKAVADMAGAPPPVIKFSNSSTAVVNDATLTKSTAEIFSAAFGPAAIELPTPSPASEDYSAFIEAGVPSVYFYIGGTDPAKFTEAQAKGESLPVNHSPLFAPLPEPTIRTGTEAMTLAILGALAR